MIRDRLGTFQMHGSCGICLHQGKLIVLVVLATTSGCYTTARKTPVGSVASDEQTEF